LQISPVDAKVTVFGEVKEGDRIDQIKVRTVLATTPDHSCVLQGMSYSLKRLIGESPRMRDSKNKLYYAVFYLAPGATNVSRFRAI
jgi:phosphatidylserine decarboxylase